MFLRVYIKGRNMYLRNSVSQSVVPVLSLICPQLTMITEALIQQVWPRKMVPLSLNPRQGRDYFASKGSLSAFFIPHPQLQVAEVKFLASVAKKLKAPFLHPTHICRVEVDPSRSRQRILGLSLPLPQLTQTAEIPYWEKQAKETRGYCPIPVFWS